MKDPHQAVSISASATDEESSSDATPARKVSIEKGTEDFLTDLIRQQCELVKANTGIILLRPMRDQSQASIVKYVGGTNTDIAPRLLKRMTDIATRTARENRSLVDTVEATQGLLSHEPDFHVLASPLCLAGRPQGASVCLVPYDRTQDEYEDQLQRLDLSGALLEAYLWKQQAYNEAQAKIQMRETLDLVDKSYRGHTAEEMASIFASEIQRRFGCTRVSIGLVKGHDVRVVGIGGTDDVDRKSELVESFEAVMEECADQDTEIRFPQPEDAEASDRRVVRAHASLSERFGPSAIASFPLRVDDGLIGVVIMERDPADPFNDPTLHLLRLVAEYVGPTIWTRRLADRGVLAISRDRSIEVAHTIVGPEKTGAKVIAIVALLLLLISVAVPVRDRVVGEGRIVAEIRRQVSAPFDGRIEKVHVQAGDRVEAGQLLVELETIRLQFQLSQKTNELAKIAAQADQAQSEGKIHEAMVLEHQRRMVQEDVNLQRYRLGRASIRAPIAGVVAQGKLDNLVGEMVGPDKPLLEIADMSTISAIMLVPESGIPRIEVGQAGALALTARPADKIAFEVIHVTPASEVYQQKNVYRVEVQLEEAPEWFRPGMEGQAKAFGNRSNLFMIFSRPVVDAIRMRFWWF